MPLSRTFDFGENVADAYVIPKPDWYSRKKAYIAHIAHASSAAQLVSAADKLHNARSILKDYREIGEIVNHV